MKSIVNGITREEVETDVIRHFNTFFTEYHVSDYVIQAAIDDVFETSAIADRGRYNCSDISLGCQRALMIAMGEEI